MKSAAVALLSLSVGCMAKDSMTFLAIGDWGGDTNLIPVTITEEENNIGMAKVARESTNGEVDFVMALGDNFYVKGINGDATCKRFKETFDDVFDSKELQVPWYVIAGNHDHYGNVTAQIEHTKLSERWTFPSLYYSFSKNFTTAAGKTIVTDVVYLDTFTLSGNSEKDDDTNTIIKPSGPLDQQAADIQIQWLEQQLSASTADYLWVAGHYPIYSPCEHGPNDIMIANVLPLLQKYNATGYLYGHDHCLSYIQEPGTSIAHVLSGAGRGCCYKPEHKNDTRIPANSIQYSLDRTTRRDVEGGFTSLDVTENATTITYHSSLGHHLFTAAPLRPRK